MEWDGIQDDVTDIADRGETSVRYLENGSLLVRGEFSRRPGFGARIDSSGIACAEIAALVVWVTASGTIVSDAQ